MRSGLAAIDFGLLSVLVTLGYAIYIHRKREETAVILTHLGIKVGSGDEVIPWSEIYSAPKGTLAVAAVSDSGFPLTALIELRARLNP